MQLEVLDAHAVTAVHALLQSAGLPVADLVTSRPKLFGVHDATGLIGVIGLEGAGPAALLRSLAVRSDQRGRRLGTTLVRALEARAPSLGVTELWLLTTTAEAFFLHLGYEPAVRDTAPVTIRETAEFRSICPSSAACLRKTLAPAPGS